MGIDEPRQQRPALELDDLGVWADVSLGLTGGTHPRDAVIADGQGLCSALASRLRALHGKNVLADKHQLGWRIGGGQHRAARAPQHEHGDQGAKLPDGRSAMLNGACFHSVEAPL